MGVPKTYCSKAIINLLVPENNKKQPGNAQVKSEIKVSIVTIFLFSFFIFLSIDQFLKAKFYHGKPPNDMLIEK